MALVRTDKLWTRFGQSAARTSGSVGRAATAMSLLLRRELIDCAAREIDSEQDHPDQEPAAEGFGRHFRTHILPDEHAGKGAGKRNAAENGGRAVEQAGGADID